MKKYLTNSSSETKNLGNEFAKKLKSGDVVLLEGALGAGKTTFVQGVAQGLKVRDRILSPTFVLIRSHSVSGSSIKKMNHIDLYRIENPTEINMLGLEETVSDEDSVSLIEWAERLTEFKQGKSLPAGRQGYRVQFKHMDKDKREIKIEKL